MTDIVGTLVLCALIFLAVWVIRLRSRRIADDAEKLMHEVLGYPKSMKAQTTSQAYADTEVNKNLYSCLIGYFNELNAASKVLRAVSGNDGFIQEDSVIKAVNDMQKEEGKNEIPKAVVKMVIEGLVASGLLAMRDGGYKETKEGAFLKDLICD